jgi:hypothetical protein
VANQAALAERSTRPVGSAHSPSTGSLRALHRHIKSGGNKGDEFVLNGPPVKLWTRPDNSSQTLYIIWRFRLLCSLTRHQAMMCLFINFCGFVPFLAGGLVIPVIFRTPRHSRQV